MCSKCIFCLFSLHRLIDSRRSFVTAAFDEPAECVIVSRATAGEFCVSNDIVNVVIGEKKITICGEVV